MDSEEVRKIRGFKQDAPEVINNADGSTSVVLQTFVTDDKGRIIGTEPRAFALARGAGQRNLVVQEPSVGKLAPSDTDKNNARTFVRLADSNPLDAALLVGNTCASQDALVRFRAAFAEAKQGEQLVDFIRARFKGQFSALGNVLLFFCYPLAEFLSDEVHLATQGLSDNFGAIADAIAAAPPNLLSEISLYYGAKFGDGRYEVKSADGRGDTERLLKDISFATKGKARDFLIAKIEACLGRRNVPAGEAASVDWKKAGPGDFDSLLRLLTDFTADLSSLRSVDAAALAKAVSGGDADLERTLFAACSERRAFWSKRLRDAVGGGKGPVNRKILLRCTAANDQAERKEILQLAAVNLGDILKGKEPENVLLRTLWGLK